MIDRSNRVREQSQQQEPQKVESPLADLGASADRSAARSNLLRLATTPHAEVAGANRSAAVMTMSVAEIGGQLEGGLINKLG